MELRREREFIWSLASVGPIGAVEQGVGLSVMPASTAIEVEAFLDGRNKLTKFSFALVARRVVWGFFHFFIIAPILREQ
jgi:hypothetical protein